MSWDGTKLARGDCDVFAVLDELVAAWDRRVEDGLRGDAVTRSAWDGVQASVGLPVPKALTSWYASGVACLQNPRILPNDIELSGGIVVFQAENQGVVLWGIEVAQMAEEDPPVVVARNEEPLQFHQATERLSIFALEATLIEIAMRTAYGLSGVVDSRDVAGFLDWCVELPIELAHWPGTRRTRFFAGGDTLAVAADDTEGETSLWIALGPEAPRRATAIAERATWNWSRLP